MKNSYIKDSDFEITFYEGLIERAPDFVQALMALGDLYTKAARYEEGLEIDKRLTRLCPDRPEILYNLACSYSLLGDREKSFAAIRRALDLGYEDLEHLQQDAGNRPEVLCLRREWDAEQSQFPRGRGH